MEAGQYWKRVNDEHGQLATIMVGLFQFSPGYGAPPQPCALCIKYFNVQISSGVFMAKGKTTKIPFPHDGVLNGP